jgi:hypothetical protein
LVGHGNDVGRHGAIKAGCRAGVESGKKTEKSEKSEVCREERILNFELAWKLLFMR